MLELNVLIMLNLKDLLSSKERIKITIFGIPDSNTFVKRSWND